MTKLQIGKLVRKLFDKLIGVNYTKLMQEPKTKISPRVYEAIKNEYEEASRQRRDDIRRLAKEGWSQREIAEYYKIDVSRVNKIIKEED